MVKSTKKPAALQLKVEQVAIGDLKHDPRNARTHNERNFDAIKASLSRYGQQKPIVVRRKDNTVLAGNGTLQAAASLGWETIAVVYSDLDGVEASAFAVADNRTAELATWDTAILESLLTDVQGAGVSTVELGFTEEEMRALIGRKDWGMTSFDAPPADQPAQITASEKVMITCHDISLRLKVREAIIVLIAANKWEGKVTV